jgi:alpha-tubulin suppressor-like RCC1 family protein
VVPVQVTGLTSGVTAVSAGGSAVCAVTAGGSVECWGYNLQGELGNNSTTNSLVPVQVAGLTSGVTAVSAGSVSACALTAGDGVECWGYNFDGDLGNNSTANSSVPVQVAGLTSGVTVVSVGGGFACAVTAGGSVKCWGSNNSGQLGNNSTTSSSVPVQVGAGADAGVSDAGTDAGASDAGTTPDSVNGSACVYEAGASVECCEGITIQSTGADGGLMTDNVSLYQYQCALFTVLPTTIDFGNVLVGSGSQIVVEPSIFCLGEPTSIFALTAASAPLFQTTHGCDPSRPLCDTTTWTVGFYPQVLGPQSTTLYITSEGSDPCESLAIPMTGTGVPWPDAAVADAGVFDTGVVDGIGSDAQAPDAPAGEDTGIGDSETQHTATAVSVEDYSACALTMGGGVECWGNNSSGNLGNNSTTNSSVPVQVSGLTSGVSALSAGAASACALTVSGGVWCWGDNTYGELGNNSTTNSSVPVQVSGLTSGVTAVSVGLAFACALTASGGVECWGWNSDGQLGNNSTTNSSVPVQVSGLTSGVTAVSAGADFACALTTGGGIECWGYNAYGQLGNNSTTNSSVPVQVSGLTSGVTAVSEACALTAGGGVECWGFNSYGQLGNGSTTNSSVPVQVSGLTSGATAVSSGGSFACALTAGGGVECWGFNSFGQLGNNSAGYSYVPVQVPGLTSGVTAVSVGGQSTCAVTAGGGIECWGYNNYGQLGNNSTTNSSVPVQVSGL